MKKILRSLNGLTSPGHLTIKDGIAYWQEKVLLHLLLVTVVIGFFTYISSVALSIRENLWIIAILDTAMYGFILFLFFKRSLSFAFRATSIPFISYLLGMVLITTLGPFGAGPVWLFFFPIITGVLLGQKMALKALIINALTIIGLGILIHFKLMDLLAAFNIKTWHLASENPLEKWIVISLNFMLLNIIATLSLTTLLNGLQKSMTDLEISEKKHRRIFENILDIYFETSLDGHVLEVSPSVEKISQYSQNELKGRSLFNIYKDMGQRDKTIQQLLKHGFLKDHEIQLLNKDGMAHFCSVNARFLMDTHGKPDRIVGIFRDISNQKAMEKENNELEEKLNRSRKMEALGLLAGGVAHDLNNILSGIVTYPELLAMDLDREDPLKKSLDIIQSSGNRAAEIVQDLLTLSRRGVITREIMNLNDLVSHFLLTPEYKKILSFHPNVSVEKQMDATIPFLKGSSVHLQKTLMNLISNAAEAQPHGGTIHICTQNKFLTKPLNGYDKIEKGEYVVLSVKDRGVGISPEDLKRIFEPFFTKKVMGRSGTGLGMAVVWGTVQDHEGYIDILSSATAGTTFTLYFPISMDHTILAEKPFSMDTCKGNGEKILIIDDVEEQRQIAGITLEKLGYQTVCVKSGEAAIQYLKENKADLLLLDMIMDPGIDGFETYRQILDFKPKQKAIIASGYSQTRQVNKTLSLGAGCYLKKPYTLEKIGMAVKNELAKTA
ncbi:MAG: response regulator [Proteobacteria bacterium]|nr:response regulator [Pseudomonadota bacterium]MBU1584850.1 response regulator [Pseudomonadota bacterium]MBU2453757.1 response regulator [Pseudomonadota bacterium]MBU2628815.1 response regulator [Pseudomonadota bacterium]